jgi:tRNA threonylcarbamoyladenosine biosynthesis protein TsaB
MNFILNIHTSTETAIVNLTYGGELLGTRMNYTPGESAAFLHEAIHDLMKKEMVILKNLSAVGISIGPGSYTGVRIGLATAYGLAFGLKIPLVTFNSLEIMAKSAIDSIKEPAGFYCPMIDARRMEVFTALYDCQLHELMAPSAMALEANSFKDLLASNKIGFLGSGSKKFQNIVRSESAYFLGTEISSQSIARISWDKFERKEFLNNCYPEPLYIKDFYTII